MTQEETNNIETVESYIEESYTGESFHSFSDLEDPVDTVE